MYDPHAHKIHIDGSAFENPGGSGGLAGIIEFPDDSNREPETIFEEGYKQTTNNRMELLACIRAFEFLRDEAARLTRYSRTYNHGFALPAAVLQTSTVMEKPRMEKCGRETDRERRLMEGFSCQETEAASSHGN